MFLAYTYRSFFLLSSKNTNVSYYIFAHHCKSGIEEVYQTHRSGARRRRPGSAPRRHSARPAPDTVRSHTENKQANKLHSAVTDYIS